MVRKLLHPQNHQLLHCSIPTTLANNNIMMMMITRSHQNHKPSSSSSSSSTSTNQNHPIHIINPRHHQNRYYNIQQTTSCSNQQSSIDNYATITQLKSDIYNILQGTNRGIFGIPSEKKSEIEEMVKMLESLNPNPYPTHDLDKLGGSWKLIYSTITILGSKRTKLGLRDFISLGDFLQLIDVAKGKAVNVIKFNVRGLNLFSGKLVIEASFKISSKSRVDICYNNSTIVPDQLMNMFRKNYDVLLGIFNPDGWLEITYVDETLRIGRDDKGNIFILERSKDTDS